MDDSFKETVRKSFKACKTDIETIQNENNELNSKIKTLEEQNLTLKSELASISSQLKELTNLIKEQSKNIVIEQPVIVEKPQKTSQIVSQIDSKDPYEALLAFKAKTNKREVLKNKLISMISEAGMNLSELKYMFVDHFKYCSKATFYNYLKELELEREIRIEREKSRNFVYLSSVRKEV